MVRRNLTLRTGDQAEDIILVPVIAVFTKYDQFKREISFRLEDQCRDTNPSLLNVEVERAFQEQYLANFKGSPPIVRLESEYFHV
jgi:hypothetical protein